MRKAKTQAEWEAERDYVRGILCKMQMGFGPGSDFSDDAECFHRYRAMQAWFAHLDGYLDIARQIDNRY